MDPLTLGLGIAAIVAVPTSAALHDRWQRAKIHRTWELLARDLDADFDPDGPRLSRNLGDERLLLSILRMSEGREPIWRTVLAVRPLLSDTPSFHIRPVDVRAILLDPARRALEDVSLGDPMFDEEYLVSTDTPRAVTWLLGPRRRDMIRALGGHASAACEGGVITVSHPGRVRDPERLHTMTRLGRELAAVGSALVADVRAVEGIRERERHPRRPPSFELTLGPSVVRLHGCWLRGAPHLLAHARSARSLPRFAARWREDGAIEGDLPTGLETILGRPPPGAVFKHDGKTVRLYAPVVRGPDDVRAAAQLVAEVAAPPRGGGAFR